ncbi:MAG: class I SAM-dependent methyltransferase [Gammaproteobacteria bacterium]|nr:class I SAM-dependent methyltransferase [Gammaproteobacteria bacterium]
MGNTDDRHPNLADLSRDPRDVAAYHDAWAEDYDADLDAWAYEAPVRVAEQLRALVPGDAVVLDAGCGTGLAGRALAAAGFSTIDGVDVSERSLAVAERTGAYRRLAAADLQALPLPLDDDAYDALVCVGVLTYLPDSEAVVREFVRLVCPGGAVVLTQRTDLHDERAFGPLLERLAGDGVIAALSVSGPRRYLPAERRVRGHPAGALRPLPRPRLTPRPDAGIRHRWPVPAGAIAPTARGPRRASVLPE